ncbi:E1A-binding protein p400 isoform X2 [Bombina bombina]|uniref:E1A-binding protein p400 isoform X2 n=1 Tax=Bombina bombina TaxID=8345 RepID=UPI00235A4E7F|nr:E1A-binding protein p400 isoform X2 [Bombina bombina]
MPHGNSSQDIQSSGQPPKNNSGSNGDVQKTQKATPQSPAPTFAPAVSSSAPQSPGYQIQQLIMSRNPVAGQNVNITLQNVGQVVAGNPQITLTPLPITSPASPGFQFSSQSRRFEHGSPSYIQVTSPMSQQVQTQSPTQPIQALQGVRTGTAGASLGMCSQSPTHGFVDAGLLVRQISLGPSSTGHFVFQEGSGIAQITQGSAQVNLQSGTSTKVPARTLLHSNPQSAGSVHPFGTQSPVATGTNIQTLTSPNHLTTTNLPQQISSIIQGQLMQQQVLHTQQLGRAICFDRTSGGMIAGMTGTSAFGLSSPTSTNSSQSTGHQVFSSLPLTTTINTTMKKVIKKLEEIPPATQEDARLRKQCLEHHHKTMKSLKENYREYLVELFFLQHFQGNMMDYLAFKKKHTLGLQSYLRQNDLDLEMDEEEREKQSSDVFLNQPRDVAPCSATENPVPMETQSSSNQNATLIDASVKQALESTQLEIGSSISKMPLVVPQLPLTPSRAGSFSPAFGMPTTQQTVPSPGQRQNEPAKVQVNQNTASSLPVNRTQVPRMQVSSVLSAAQLVNPQQTTEATSQTKGKLQPRNIFGTQIQTSQQPQGKPLDQTSSPKPSSMHAMQASASKLGSDAVKHTGSVSVNPSPLSPATPASILDSTPPPANASPKRILSPGASKTLSPSTCRSPSSGVSQTQDVPMLPQVPVELPQDTSVPKPIEQENHIHQRIAELRKEGLWSLKRLPKLQEASRPKSHWDYLLEEMQWMAADFAQERMWKLASAKKLVRTAARYCLEKQQNDARAKKEDEERLRRIAWLAAREIQCFWSNIEQVVEIKLQVELQERKRRLFVAQKVKKGQETVKLETEVKGEQNTDPRFSGPKRKLEASKAEIKAPNSEVGSGGAQQPVVLIDSLLSLEGAGTANMGARKHCRDIAEVAAAAELLMPRGCSRITSAGKTSPPALLHGTLREYQQIGLDWMAKQYKKNLNGILADESGLGKNVQVIALLAHLASNEGVWGPHLIIVRSCKILKWELELKRWCPALKLLLYFGSQRELRRKRQEWAEPNSFHVCITSYKQLFKGRQAFMKMRWKYLVLDEVHQIRHMREKHWDAIFNLPSQRRLLLRDTPLPHTWMDLWAMVHFLIPGLSKPYLDFPPQASNDQEQEYRHTISIRLHRSTQPFILRRSKRDVEKQLNKKSEHVLKCQLSNRQRTLYEDVMMQPGTQDALKGGHFVSVLHVLMQLQRICNHPELVNPRPAYFSYVCEALQYMTASLALRALEYDPWKEADLSLFDLLGIENKMTRYEAQVLPKQKVTRKLIQEIYASSDPAPRPNKVKIKPSKLFEPVLYGQKPEGRTITFQTPSATRPSTTTTTTTVTQQGQVKKPSVTTPTVLQGTRAPTTQSQTSHVTLAAPRPQAPATFTTAAPMRQLTQPHSQNPAQTVQQSVMSPRLVLSSQARLPSGEVVKIAQLASAGGAQGRIAQPETPVTLQFQGNKFTLSQSQLRQLTTGQPLQLQGNVLQIVSAPGQYLRQQGSVVLPTVPHGTPANTIRNQQLAGSLHPGAVTTPASVIGKSVQGVSTVSDPATKSTPTAISSSQASVEEKQRIIRERLDRLFSCNERRCGRVPVYGADLLSLCSLRPTGVTNISSHSQWRWAGSANCFLSSCNPVDSSDLLRHLILSTDQQKAALGTLARRALCVVAPAVASPPVLIVPHSPPTYTHAIKILSHGLRELVSPSLQCLRERTSPYCVQFPDLRLIQCDSGKLETLAVLVRKLRSEGRRVLIFSQMLLMLDILELFLDFHSLKFLRIDENANYEQRQDLMKSFNRDPQIFCLLLSTHIHSLDVSHAEADTVIFYDSDLNPVIDGKTQSWCDQIGKAKDIHIYRLVSASSIEEKLLKNGTKDLIREVAAQGSDYSLAFLTQQTIQELFEDCSALEDSGFKVKAEEFVMLSQEPSSSDIITPKVARPFVEALDRIESGEEDISAHMQDDRQKPNSEILPLEACGQITDQEPSQLQELADLMQQLTPIEKYALHYLEFHIHNNGALYGVNKEQLNAAKQEWDMKHLRGLKELEDRMQWETQEDDDLLLTFTREDAYKMDFIYDGPDGHTEIMPVWTPPTPPQDENDIYIDSVMCLMYDANPIPESKLPLVYVRKERKRHKTDPAAAGRKKKQRHGESVVPPRSLFDRQAPNPIKVRKEGKEQKKNILLKHQTQFAKPLPTLIKPVMETGPENPEWLISEDWALLQAVKQLLELPLNLAIVSPAHTPNWDLVSDVVNSCSRIYRSSKQCRSRYENVIIPREEGKLLYDVSPKKKTESLFKNKPLRTSQIYAQDEGMSHIQLFTARFELMKMTAGKRSPPSKPLLGMNPFQKNPKHASVLSESGINYDKPLPPIQVALLRADRIAKEKKALVEQARAQQQSSPLTQQPQQNGQQPTPLATVQPAQAQPQTPGASQPQVVVQQQVTKGPATGTASISSPTLLTGTIKTAVPGTSITTATVSGNVIVNTVAGVSPATFQPINKRLVSPVVTGTLSAPGAAAGQIVQQRTATTPTAPSEMVTIATSQGVRTVTPVTGGTVVSTNLTPVQTQTRAIVTQVTTATTAGVQLASKTITQAQFQLLRQQQAAQVQVPQIQAQSQGQIKAVAKISQEQLLKLQKQKLQLSQQVAQASTLAGTTTQVQVQPQQTQQLATVTASRAGTVLTGATVTNLQVARLLQAQGQIQAQQGQTAQVTLTKPPVVSAVVSGGVTTLPVTVAGISVSINQPQKVAGGHTVMAQPLHVQPLLKLKQHHTPQQQQQQQQKALQATLGQQKITPQVSTASQQQKVTYTTQPAIKTQFLTTNLGQAQKAPGAQQVQAQIQVAKLPQVVQQQAAIATIQQVVSASQQVQPQTVTLTQATATGQHQVQMISANSAAAQVVQQKFLQQQQMVAASQQIQTPTSQSTAPPLGTTEAQNQQAKLQVRPQTVRIKVPTKPS